MKRVFADANYFVALLNPRDDCHAAALVAQNDLAAAHLVTTDEVLAEFLTFFCELGPQAKNAAVQVVEGLRKNARVTVVEQSRATFDGGLGRYKRFADKKWSIADCVSFELMTRDSIAEALTNDRHFEQAGFVARLRALGK